MGYGGKAMQLLQHYFEGKFPSLAEDTANTNSNNDNNGAEETHAGSTESTPVNGDDGSNSLLLKEKIAPRKKLPPLLLKLNERRPESLDYLGVAFGLTESLLKVGHTSRELT